MRRLFLILALLSGACLATEDSLETRTFTYIVLGCRFPAAKDPDETPKTPEEQAAGAEKEAREEREWSEKLKRRLSDDYGVTWPEGASVRVIDDGGLTLFLWVKNTHANLQRIARGLRQCLRPAVLLRFLKVTPEALSAVGWNDSERPDPETLWRRLRARPDVSVLAAPESLLDVGCWDLHLAGVAERSHPTERVTLTSHGRPLVVPKVFEVENCGVELELSCYLGFPEELIELTLKSSVTSLHGEECSDDPLRPILAKNERVDRLNLVSDKMFVCPVAENVLVFGKVRLERIPRGEKK